MPPFSKITRLSAAVAHLLSFVKYSYPIFTEFLGKSWHRSEDNIRMNVNEMACKDVNLIRLVEDMDQWWGYLNTIMKFNRPQSCLF
jgi:hypothetical protein